MPFKANPFFELSINENEISIKLTIDGVVKNATRSISKSRSFILKKYNWNGVIKLMRFVYKKHDETYEVPENLKGTEADNLLLVPDRGLAFMISCQLLKALDINKPLKAAKINTILKFADGFAGNDFCNKVIGKQREVFVNESLNKALKDPQSGTTLSPPASNALPDVYYDYLKRLVRLRNGLWSTEPGVVNLVGLRRVLVEKRSEDAGYNDTIAACWLDQQGIPHCELNIATTEPGDRSKSRQLLPQTMTLVPGYHNLRQPGGRTRTALKEGSEEGINIRKINDQIPFFCDGDTTMNFHQGGNNFLYPSKPGLTKRQAQRERKLWMSKFGLTESMQKGNPSAKADGETLFKLNHVLTEIYLILSRYGEDGNQAPYRNMSNMTGHPPISRTGVINGKITVSQDGQADKVIDVANAKFRTVRIWIDGRRNEETKKKIYEILKHISDYTPEEIKTWKNLSMNQIIALIKDEHIEHIVDIQMQYLTHISKIVKGKRRSVDGIAGNDFYKMIHGIWQKKADAERDKMRMDELLEELDQLPLQKRIKNIFKTGMTIRTYTNRTNVLDKTKHLDASDLDIVADVSVGGYSAGCQVFFDTEVFYTFWNKLLHRAQQSGQRRWYYTLIDATKFKKSGVI